MYLAFRNMYDKLFSSNISGKNSGLLCVTTTTTKKIKAQGLIMLRNLFPFL